MAREERYLAMAARQRNGNSGGWRKRFVKNDRTKDQRGDKTAAQ